MISKQKQLLIFMSMCEIAIKKQEKILEIAHEDFSIEKILKNQEISALLTTEEYHKMLTTYSAAMMEKICDQIENNGITLLSIFDEDYPKALENLPERPILLFSKGDLELLKKPAFAIVGTRSPTNYGRVVTENFAAELARAGLVIVSGLGYGVDSIAHRKTLQEGGKTIAVIGSGLNKIYPAANTSLAEEIAERGLLLSEYPPDFAPKRYTFPQRNRIVAGLADGVLITEAAIKSGTIYTKDFATAYGKEVFAVPGNVTSSKSELPNHLIKTSTALCALSADDILDFYGIKKQPLHQHTISLSFDQQKILNLLSDGEKDFDFLAKKSDIPVNILNSCLTTLEISGLIKRLPAKTYCLA